MVKKKKEEEKGTKTKIRIKLKGYDHKLVDAWAKKIVEIFWRYGAEFAGPIPLPTEIKRYTVGRTTFVHKDAREQFEIRIHKRLIEVYDPDPKVIEGLQNISLPAGVDIEIQA